MPLGRITPYRGLAALRAASDGDIVAEFVVVRAVDLTHAADA